MPATAAQPLLDAGPATSASAPGGCQIRDEALRGEYVGGCVDGWAEGKGEARGKDRYQGTFHAGHLQGIGIYTWASGDRYEGPFAEGEMHGKGRYTFASGDRFEGEFVMGKREGQGTYVWRDGSRYVGQYQGDLREGFGLLSLNLQSDRRELVNLMQQLKDLQQLRRRGNMLEVRGWWVRNVLVRECANAEDCRAQGLPDNRLP